MPQNLAPASPQGVLPAGLSAAFVEELRVENFVNLYLDGTSTRFALAVNPRRFFKFTRKLVVDPVHGIDQYQDLWNFYQSHLIQPFYYYHPLETTPPFSYDPTGNQTAGRYVCVFDGSWSDATQLGRSQVSFGLREVA